MVACRDGLLLPHEVTSGLREDADNDMRQKVADQRGREKARSAAGSELKALLSLA